MTDPALAHTLTSVLDTLRGTANRERSVGELLANAFLWIDVATGISAIGSHWSFSTQKKDVERARLTEAPYLAAIGFLVALDIVPASDDISSALAKVMQRTPRTVERTGYADDPVVLAGLWLLSSNLKDRSRSKLKSEAERAVAGEGISPAVVAMISLVDESVPVAVRPFVASQPVELAVAICTASASAAVHERLFPQLDSDDAGRRLVAAACSGLLNPSDDLEKGFVAIALSRSIDAAASGASITRSPRRVEEVDVAFIVALREEFRVLYPWLKAAEVVKVRDRHYYRAQVGPDRAHSAVATFIGDMGAVPAAAVSSAVFDEWNPRYVVLVGIAGSVNKDVRLGDVIVATQVDSYMESGKAVDDDGAFTLLHSGSVFRADRKLVGLVRNLEFAHPSLFAAWQQRCRTTYETEPKLTATGSLDCDPQVCDGFIASGPVVGASDEFRRWLLRRERAYKALEMEGAGVLWAAEEAWQPPKTLVVRGVSDRADPGKAALDDVGKGAIRAWAMGNAVAFVWTLLDAGMLA